MKEYHVTSAYILKQVAQREHPNVNVREEPNAVGFDFFRSDT